MRLASVCIFSILLFSAGFFGIGGIQFQEAPSENVSPADFEIREMTTERGQFHLPLTPYTVSTSETPTENESSLDIETPPQNSLHERSFPTLTVIGFLILFTLVGWAVMSGRND